MWCSWHLSLLLWGLGCTTEAQCKCFHRSHKVNARVTNDNDVSFIFKPWDRDYGWAPLCWWLNSGNCLFSEGYSKTPGGLIRTVMFVINDNGMLPNLATVGKEVEIKQQFLRLAAMISCEPQDSPSHPSSWMGTVVCLQLSHLIISVSTRHRPHPSLGGWHQDSIALLGPVLSHLVDSESQRWEASLVCVSSI